MQTSESFCYIKSFLFIMQTNQGTINPHTCFTRLLRWFKSLKWFRALQHSAEQRSAWRSRCKALGTPVSRFEGNQEATHVRMVVCVIRVMQWPGWVLGTSRPHLSSESLTCEFLHTLEILNKNLGWFNSWGFWVFVWVHHFTNSSIK